MGLSLATLLFFFAVGVLGGEPGMQSAILEVFPTSAKPVSEARRGKTVITPRYTPSGSLWDAGLDERWVFHCELRHEQDAVNSFAMRIGKGGQIYSLRGPFGESVPPSWRPGRELSAWNDEVWQFVAVCSRYNGLRALLRDGSVPEEVAARFKRCPYKTSFFVHDSGAYTHADSAVRFLYCPMLASGATPDGRGYRTLNWGILPQLRTVHRSPVLYYCQSRDLGDGVIELTWVVHNFGVRGDVVFDHLNAPWGGTRVSSLPFHYISSPGGELRTRERLMPGNTVNVRATGGWSLWCATEAPDSPSLAFVFGRDKRLEEEMRRAAEGKPHVQLRPSLYRDWRAGAPMYKHRWKDWRTRPANTFRNYDVATVARRLRLAPGATIWSRCFLVVNRRDRAVGLARSLADHVDYGRLEFDPANTPLIPVSIGAGAPTFELFARPVRGTMPLFLIQNTKTGRQVVTTDPYIFVPREKLDLGIPRQHPHHDYYSRACGYSMDRNSSDWKRLLGFGHVERPASGCWVRLSSLLDRSHFPAPDTYHLDLWVKATTRR